MVEGCLIFIEFRFAGHTQELFGYKKQLLKKNIYWVQEDMEITVGKSFES